MPTPADQAGPRARPAKHGVIHDIGYRHYAGPRLGRGYVARALFAESAKGAYGLGRSARAKAMPMLLLAAICLPAVIVAVVAGVTKVDELPGGYTSYLVSTQLLISVFVASQSPASVSRDLRFRVMSLYFARPLERADYVLAKYAALALAIFVLIAAPLTILLAGALLAKLPLSDQVPDYLRSLAGAAMCALVVAGIGLVIAAVTPRRGLGVAAIISVLVVLAGVRAAVEGIALEEDADTVAEYAGLLSPFTLVDGVQSALLGAEVTGLAGPADVAGGLVYLLVMVLLIAACGAMLLLRYRRVSV
jgi:ABC-2 type transport system permease protein